MNSPRSMLVMGTVGVGLTILASQSGCVLASPTYVTTQESAAKAADSGATGAQTGGGTAGGGATCSNSFIKPDMAKLTACGNGKGHCYDKAKFPGDTSQFTPCADANQVCLPDEILKAGGEKLKSCTSIIGPGGCITSALLPELDRQGKGTLKQDVCDAEQLCAPCVNPLAGNAPTPFCQPTGVYAEACVQTGGAATGGSADAGATAPAAPCCTTNGTSNGMCIPSSSIPDGYKSQVIQDTCTAGNSCVPKGLTSTNPPRCTTSAGQGVCIDKCFNGLMALGGALGVLERNWCGPTEVCIPCSFMSGMDVPGCT